MCKLSHMILRKSIYLFFIGLMVFGSIGWSQFVDVNVDLDMRRISEGDRQLLNTLREDIEQYYLNTQFSPDVIDLGLAIDIHLVLESVTHGGNQTTINAQAIFTNKLDQYFYAKGIQFPYSKSQRVIYTSQFNPLASFLNYYAFMFIATELDTWEYLSGTSFFSRAIELSDVGKDSDWSDGWDDRWKKARNIKNNQYLRSLRFNFFKALDALRAEEVNANLIKTSMEAFYENLKLIEKKEGVNKETLKFLDAYHERVSELMAALNMERGLKFLMSYDHDHKKVYESYLND